VGVRPEGPAEGHGRAGGGSGVERGGLSAGIALNGSGCDVLDGAVAGDGARDPGGLNSRVSLRGSHDWISYWYLVGAHIWVHVGLNACE
jgi:hypothetical protein